MGEAINACRSSSSTSLGSRKQRLRDRVNMVRLIVFDVPKICYIGTLLNLVKLIIGRVICPNVSDILINLLTYIHVGILSYRLKL